ncbi:MAG: GTP cyclohydrolase I FolE [Aliiglaciecola sp.]|uniref:GTP cyclohydrolase I FolE n=1 Tax=Aliiglaciecola sp. M165 TaxID=2593649 RepID=UPI00117F7237|nr:GTP cyclohydrolase I FolE [Aliiglaciecola sp. M165]TRY33772.1 GTP cyclohydrolase I FolE [Aliiglaciecola sp. M165]
MLNTQVVSVREALSDQAIAVRNALTEQGLETPMRETGLSDAEKRAKIQAAMGDIMRTLGLDLNDDSLCDTPSRIAKMYVDEIFSGLDYRRFPKITAIENKMNTQEMVKVSDISLTSTCEHHFVTIDGTANVAYIPKDKVLGLSKINRLVDFFSQRPQVQERLTQQVLLAIQTIVGTEDVAITINATHYCVKARGVRDNTSYTKTSALGGVFQNDPNMRAEFFAKD